MIAFSTAFTIERSHTCTLIMRGCGMLMVASWLSLAKTPPKLCALLTKGYQRPQKTFAIGSTGLKASGHQPTFAVLAKSWPSCHPEGTREDYGNLRPSISAFITDLLCATNSKNH